jgi:hypothetical protein
MLNSINRFFLENRLIAFLLLIVSSALGPVKALFQFDIGMLARTLGKAGHVCNASTNGSMHELLLQYVLYGTGLPIVSPEELIRNENESNERNSIQLRTIKSK